MSALHGGQFIRSSIEAISQWCREWAERGSLAELGCCGEEDIEGMARDVGVSVDEFRRLVRRGPHSADLLLRRMAALDLDQAELLRSEPQTLHDLQRVCTMCVCHRRCARDLAHAPGDPAWEEYCPNAATLEALNAQPWAARREW